jgi:hypothetical protein
MRRHIGPSCYTAPIHGGIPMGTSEHTVNTRRSWTLLAAAIAAVSVHGALVGQTWSSQPAGRGDRDTANQVLERVPTLASRIQELNSLCAAISPEGMLWSCPVNGGVSCFDGNKWKSIFDRRYSGTVLFAGQKGELLAWQGRNFTFLNGSDRKDGSRLDDLIKDNSKGFVAAFSGASNPNQFRSNVNRSLSNPEEPSGMPGEGGWSIAVDKDNRIWLTISRTLRVLDSGQWVSVVWPADSNTPGPSLAIPVGDASSMYIWASKPQLDSDTTMSTIKSYLAQFKDGKVVFSEAPSPGGGTRLFADVERKLWVLDEKLNVRRIDEKGVFDTFSLSQKPILLDKSGIVWLEASDGAFSLWKNGKITGTVKVPKVDASSRAFSDKPGSVWVWGASGLHHCVAPAGTAEFAMVSSYSVEGPDGSLFREKPEGDEGVSPEGFMYVVVRSSTPRQFVLHTIQLPER